MDVWRTVGDMGLDGYTNPATMTVITVVNTVLDKTRTITAYPHDYISTSLVTNKAGTKLGTITYEHAGQFTTTVL